MNTLVSFEGVAIPTIFREYRDVAQKSFTLGVFYVLLSSLFLSTGFLLVKVNAVHFPFFFLVFVRFFVGLCCFLVLLFFSHTFRKALRTQFLKWHIFRALVVTAAQYCLFFYLTRSTLLNATVFMNLAPLFIPLFDVLLLGHTIKRSTLIGLLLSGIGVVLILKPGTDLFRWVSLIGLLAGFLWALSQVIYGKNVKKEPKETSIFYLFLFCSLFSLIFLIFAPSQMEGLLFTPQIIFLLILLGVITFLSQFFRGKAYHEKAPSTLATFLYFSLLFSMLFDWLVFHTIPGVLTFVGAALVALGGILKVLLRQKRSL